MSNLLTRSDVRTRAGAPTRAAGAPPGRSSKSGPGGGVTMFALVGGVAAAGVGLVAMALVVIVTWAASPGGGVGAADALRAVGAIWLVAHRVTVTFAGADIALLPIGLLALPAYTVFRSGRWLAHSTAIADVRGAVAAGLTLGCAYGFAAALVASLCTTRTLHPAQGQALVAGSVVGVVFGIAGVLHGAALWRPVWGLIPPRGTAVLRGAGVALAVVLGTGALLVLGGLTMHAGRVVDLGTALHPGTVGAFSLALACVAYAPNAVVWGSAYAVGPGFSVGAGTAVSPLGVHLGAVPAFPLLGALPGDGGGTPLAWIALAAPYVAGGVAGVLLIRWLPGLRVEEAALWGLVTGVGAGAMLGILAALSGGPAGPGRLATMGPSAWQVGLAAAVEMGVAAAAAAAETQRRLTRHRPDS